MHEIMWNQSIFQVISSINVISVKRLLTIEENCTLIKVENTNKLDKNINKLFERLTFYILMASNTFNFRRYICIIKSGKNIMYTFAI